LGLQPTGAYSFQALQECLHSCGPNEAISSPALASLSKRLLQAERSHERILKELQEDMLTMKGRLIRIKEVVIHTRQAVYKNRETLAVVECNWSR